MLPLRTTRCICVPCRIQLQQAAAITGKRRKLAARESADRLGPGPPGTVPIVSNDWSLTSTVCSRGLQARAEEV